MCEHTTCTATNQTLEPQHDARGEIQIIKQPYAAPKLSLIEAVDIESGVSNLQESDDGGGFVS